MFQRINLLLHMHDEKIINEQQLTQWLRFHEWNNEQKELRKRLSIN